jgi:hypothetical protein
MFGAAQRHLTTFRSGLILAFGTYGARGAIVTDPQYNPAVDRCRATAGVDVKKTYRIAPVDVATGRQAALTNAPERILELLLWSGVFLLCENRRGQAPRF